MGFLHCHGISSVFVDYLKNVGPISIEETVAKFHTCHDGDMGRMSPAEIKEHAAWALTCAVTGYVQACLIEVCERETGGSGAPLWRLTDTARLNPDMLQPFDGVDC